MYESLNQPIPDVDAYLDRIGLTDPLPGGVEGLNLLVYHHQTHVPFEDLNTSYFHAPVPLDIPTLYEKVVVNHRGGYCYELNALFTRLLCDLGYEARSVFCRYIRGRDFLPPCAHRAVVVKLGDDMYFCDVGFGGPMPAGAVKIEDGNTAVIHGEPFHIDRWDDYWWTVSRTTSDGNREKLIQFSTFPQTPQEFIAANQKAATDPDSIFVTKVTVNLRTPAGSIAIDGDTFTRRENGQVETLHIEDDTHFRRLLADAFGMRPECLQFADN